MNKQAFLQKLGREPLPQVVDFWAPWCGPCRMTKPVLQKLAEEFKGKVGFSMINADEHPDLVRELGIFGIPTLLVIKDGEIIGRYTGAQTPENYRQIFASLAEGKAAALPVARMDRFIRLGLAAFFFLLAWNNQAAWLAIPGLLFFLWAIHDRCPLMRAIRERWLQHG